MRYTVPILVLAIAVGYGLPAHGQTSGNSDQIRQSAPLLTTNSTLLASLNRISKGSALWREAIADVRRNARRVLVVTPGEVMVAEGERNQAGRSFDPSALAGAFPVADEDSRVSLVVVVVNLRLIRSNHDSQMSVMRQFEADLDRILVHEIYGHALPYLLAGDLSGKCADPGPEEAARDACSIRRENAVRAELGLGRRDDRGLYSLALARGAL
jgi:hypothetical protein